MDPNLEIERMINDIEFRDPRLKKGRYRDRSQMAREREREREKPYKKLQDCSKDLKRKILQMAEGQTKKTQKQKER